MAAPSTAAPSWIERFRVRGLVTWGLFVALIFSLRDFFLTIFLTFVFAYILNTLVALLTKLIRFRRVNVVIVYLLFLAAVTAISAWLFPRLIDEGRTMVTKVVETLPPKTPEREIYGPQPRSNQEEEEQDDTSSEEEELPEAQQPASDGVTLQPAEKETSEKERRGLMKLEPVWDTLEWIEKRWGLDFRKQAEEQVLLAGTRLKELLQQEFPAILGVVAGTAGSAVAWTLKVAIQIVLSLIFSFLIVLNLPRIGLRLRALRQSRAGPIYDEIAPGVVCLGQTLGRAFQAQALIAIVNTILTYAGLVLLGIPNKGFLSTIVFFCSFIPILGVFISSVPICLVALTMEGGSLLTVAECVLMITVVHSIEAYILNPNIYGARLHLPPLLVLVVLVTAEHFFGVWGLLLAVPLCFFVLDYMIYGKVEDAHARAGVPLLKPSKS